MACIEILQNAQVYLELPLGRGNINEAGRLVPDDPVTSSEI